ncbi:unnamed protein product [Arabis nemorensis]|uniref:BHLH domain-containing protein n=1 Tax=Arabis nemorensis TaxID=586526 RepID=A0A565CPS6_9BRAS|nr:unnamed protein product [Arabis nemorensis]
MATFSYFQHYPNSLLDPVLFPTPNSSVKLSGFINQNTATIEDTSLNAFLDSYYADKTENSGLKKQSNTNTTVGASSRDELSHGPATTSAGNKRRRNNRKGSNSMEGVEERKSKKQRNGSPSDVKEKRGRGEEPPKDYIHVRARRGQATDSHSLAERVRREKISERMRILQNLVPGCDKVTGKALMLDEIINYVQSLQYQVEFLSMKLASISPVDLDGLIQSKEEGEEREKFVDRSGFNSNSFCSFS